MKAGIYKLFDGGLIYVRKDRTVSAIAGTEYPVQTGTKAQTFEGGKTILITAGSQQFHGDRHADVPNGCTDHQALVDSMHMAANLEPGQRVVDYGTKSARVEEIDNPADMARAITKNCAKALGVEVDHESFNKAAEELAKPVTDDEFDRIKAGADDPYKRMAEHMRGCEKAMRHVGEAATGAAEAVRRYFVVPPALAAPYGEADLVEWRKKFSASLRKQGFRICHKVSARKHRKRGHTVVPLHDNWFAWRPVDYLHPYQRDLVNRFKGLTLKVPAGLGKTEMMAVPRTLIYVGPLEHLKGKKALTMPARSSGVLLAQFDDITATRSGEPLPKIETLEYEPHARFPTVTQTDPPEPPADALGFRWHEFPSADFAAAGA